MKNKKIERRKILQKDNNQNNNLNNSNMNGNNNPNGNKNKSRNWIFLIMLLVVVSIMLIFSSTNSSIEKLEKSELLEKLNNNEIVAVYTQNGNERGKVLLRENADKIKEFPSKSADYWFVYDATVKDMLQQYIMNETNPPPNDFVWKTDASPVNWSAFIMPVLYIIFFILIIYFIYKMLGKTGGKFMGFGKNKMRSDQKVNVKFENVAGIKEEKEELVEIVDYLKNPKKYVSMGARIPKGVLLVGEPGTGKTLLAKAIAGESGVPFFSISGSDFVEMYVGVGASRVRELFEEAKKNLPCIIFIDEIDAVGRIRGVGLGGGNDEREQTLNQLLVEMDGFEMNEGLIVMAATNRVDILDPALTRPGRFDRRIHVYPPDVKGREEILAVYAKNKPMAQDVDMKKLARVTGGFTGADIENLLNESALFAARENKPQIEMEDVLNCVNKVRLGLAKTSRAVTEKTKLRTAYHESGHAILCKLLDCGDLQEVSITPRGFAGGYTAHISKDESALYTKNQLNDLIAQAMGGRIAEFLQFTDVSVGAENDIRQASKIARNMVTDWGMSDNLGFIAYNNENDMFEDSRVPNSNKFSESITSEIDNEVRNIINYNYDRALKILQENKPLLDEMAELLMDRETIYDYEVDELINGKSAKTVIREIEEKEAEKKKQQNFNKAVIKVKDLICEREYNVKSIELLINTTKTNKNEINQVINLVKKENKTKFQFIRKNCQKDNIDFEEVYKTALNGLTNTQDVNDLQELYKEIIAENIDDNSKIEPCVMNGEKEEINVQKTNENSSKTTAENAEKPMETHFEEVAINEEKTKNEEIAKSKVSVGKAEKSKDSHKTINNSSNTDKADK